MKETLEYIISTIVDNKEAVEIEEQKQEEKTVLVIHVDENDIGKVIGKNGRIIRAIRDIIKVLAIKHNVFVDVIIEDN